MSKINDGGPAFPIVDPAYDPEGFGHFRGMSLRDFVAATVMQLACEDYPPHEAARLSFEYADAFLYARDAGQP